MLEHLPDELLEGLARMQRSAAQRDAGLQVRADGRSYPVLRYWDGGFAIGSAGAPRLRGLVDLHRGELHLSRCLIVACAEAEGEISYEFKHRTPAEDSPPRDHARPETEAPRRLPGATGH